MKVLIETITNAVAGEFDFAAIYCGDFGVFHTAMTAAIPRLRIRADGHPTDGLVGTLTLYGEL